MRISLTANGVWRARDGSMRQVDPLRNKPPARAGIGASCVVLPPGDWSSVLDYLVARFPNVDAGEWQARMRNGDVVDERGGTVAPDRAYEPRLRLYYFRDVPDEQANPAEETLLYRDEYIAVVDKPHGLPVVPSGRHLHETLLARLQRRLGIDTAAPAHRIDRDTAGLVLFSLQPGTRGAYHALFRERRVTKRYEAIAPHRPSLAWPLERRSRLAESPASFMQMHEVPGEPNACTRIELLEVQGSFARYGLSPSTGQRHQLRVHLAALGVPIVNDRIYPVLQPDAAGNREALERERREPLQLLAKGLAFDDPITGEARSFQSGRQLQFGLPE